MSEFDECASSSCNSAILQSAIRNLIRYVRPLLPSLDRRHLRPPPKTPRRDALSARAHARAALSLQPGLRRLRQDSVPGRNPPPPAYSRAMFRRGRRVRRPGHFHSRRRAALASADRPDRGRPRRSGESSSISAPTPSSWKSPCPASRRPNTSRSPFTWTAPATSTTWPSAAKGPTTSPSRAIKAARARGFRVTTNTTLFAGAESRARPHLLRRDDGPRRRRNDDLARLQLRKGS